MLQKEIFRLIWSFSVFLWSSWQISVFCLCLAVSIRDLL